MTTKPHTPFALLRGWLARQLDAAAADWLDGRIAVVGPGGSDRDLYLAVGLAPRKVGKGDLRLDAADLAAAEAARPDWSPTGWSVDQAARIVLLLATAEDADSFPRRFEELCSTAEVRESIAFYRGLPLYPGPERFVARSGEGVRTNMKSVFEAVAHRNPYPTEQFDEHTWNQMVLKAVFVGSALDPIHGFDARRNVPLARTMVDYAHERWAAGRDVAPELWRAVGRHADDVAIEDLRRVLASDNPVERQAGALALRESSHPAAAALLADAADLVSDIEAGRVSWETVCRDCQNS